MRSLSIEFNIDSISPCSLILSCGPHGICTEGACACGDSDCTDAQLAPTEQARKFCNYLGVESNAQLQCHLRSLNYTLVFTGGGFEHMPKCFSRDFGDCERGEGYVEEVEGLGELCVTWIAERLPAELLH